MKGMPPLLEAHVLAKRLGAKVDLGEGTARAYLGTFLTELEGEGRSA